MARTFPRSLVDGVLHAAGEHCGFDHTVRNRILASTSVWAVA